MCRRVVLVLGVLGLLSQGSATDWLQNISHNLHHDLTGVLNTAKIVYDEPVLNYTYVSRSDFDMRAMGPLYNATAIIIDLISNKQAYPAGIVSVSDGHLEIAPPAEHWRELLTHYAGSASILVITLLLVAALPLAGLFWCCCYWCRTGRRRRPFDRKYDACLKGLLAILLIALLTLFLCGVVCVFATEEQVERGARGGGPQVSRGARDVAVLLNGTRDHSRHLLTHNYRQLRGRLEHMLNSSGTLLSVQLGEFSRAASVSTLTTMVRDLGGVQRHLYQVRNLTSELQYNAERLNTGLRKVKNQLLHTLAECDQPQCRKLQEKYKIGQLDTEIHYSQIPDVSSLLNNVTRLLESNITEEVSAGQKVFTDIQLAVQRSIEKHIPTAREALHDAGRRLEKVADEIGWRTDNASAWILHNAEEVADTIRTTHQRYGHYRRYVALGTAVALLSVVMFLSWGLICGVCGKRPDVYGQTDCCNKAHGSRALLCGIGLMFLVGGAVCLVAAVYFTIGILGERLICEPLREPRDNRVFADMERMVDLEMTIFHKHEDPNFNITKVITSCHLNKTLYESLSLHRILDISSLLRSVEQQLEDKMSSLKPVYPKGRTIRILTPAARDKLTQLADTGLSDFNFDKILDALETNMTSLSLDALSSQLDSAASDLSSRGPGYMRLSVELADSATQLRAYHQTIVLPMIESTARLNATALQLRDGLRFNHSSLSDAVMYLMAETEQAETFLNTHGPELIYNLSRSFVLSVRELVTEYGTLLETGATHTVGRCGPISNAYNHTRDAACRDILLPANGFWVSILWCVILIVPILVVAQRLARLYLHLDPYPGPLVEAEYLYDAYADRDNVPLANAYKVEKRSRRPRPRSAAETEGAAPPADLQPRRYHDMAPKQWEEGPPRYGAGGPTEYERPPPYYYPGPADRQ